MFKLIPYFISSSLALVFAQILQTSNVLTWGELGIIKQVSIFAGLSLMFLVAVLGCIVLNSVWIKNGYAGIDGILEGKEVALLMSHIFGFISLEVFIFMITFRAELNPPSYAFWICSGTFIAPEVYMALSTILNRKPKD